MTVPASTLPPSSSRMSHLVAGDAVRYAGPGRGQHVPANLDVPRPALDQSLQALQLGYRQDLVQVHLSFQRLGSVKGELEAV